MLLNIFKKNNTYENTNKYDQKNTLKLLYYLAKADGVICNEEEVLIKELSKNYGLGEIEVRSIVSEFKDEPIEKAKIKYPTQQHQIEDVIKDLISVMIADKKIEISEFRFILNIAEKLNQDMVIIDKILQPFLFGDTIGTSIMERKTRAQLQIVWEQMKKDS